MINDDSYIALRSKLTIEFLPSMEGILTEAGFWLHDALKCRRDKINDAKYEFSFKIIYRSKFMKRNLGTAMYESILFFFPLSA